MANFEIVTFPVGALQCNCSILFHSPTRSAIVVDPGDEADKIFDCLKAYDYPVKALWHTHAHLDHIGATKNLFEMCEVWNKTKDQPKPKVYLYQDDLWLYKNVHTQCQLLGFQTFEVMSPTDLLVRKTTIELPELISFKTPGHTPGSACMCVQDACEFQAPQEFFQSKAHPGMKALFTGDTLFRRSIGRTDLWGGSMAEIEKSIQDKLYTLPDDYLVIPGHGPFTTLGEEAEKNNFVRKKN